MAPHVNYCEYNKIEDNTKDLPNPSSSSYYQEYQVINNSNTATEQSTVVDQQFNQQTHQDYQQQFSFDNYYTTNSNLNTNLFQTLSPHTPDTPFDTDCSSNSTDFSSTGTNMTPNNFYDINNLNDDFCNFPTVSTANSTATGTVTAGALIDEDNLNLSSVFDDLCEQPTTSTNQYGSNLRFNSTPSTAYHQQTQNPSQYAIEIKTEPVYNSDEIASSSQHQQQRHTQKLTKAQKKNVREIHYGPLVVRPRRNPAPTLASGRKSKYVELTPDEAYKRDLRRTRNRQAAEKCKRKRIEIEDTLNFSLVQLKDTYTSLCSELDSLKTEKQILQSILDQHNCNLKQSPYTPQPPSQSQVFSNYQSPSSYYTTVSSSSYTNQSFNNSNNNNNMC